MTSGTKKTWIDPKSLPKVQRGTLRRIIGYLARYRWSVILVIGILAGAAGLQLVPPLLSKRIIDRAVPHHDTHELAWLCIGMVAAPLGAGLLSLAQKYMTARIGEEVMCDLRVKLFKTLHRQPIGWFTKAKPGEALSRILNDVQGCGSAVSSTLVGVADNTIVFASTLVTLAVLDWRLAAGAALFLPIFVVPTRSVGRKRKALKRRTQEQMAELTSLLAETLSVSGALLLKVFATEKYERRRVERKAREIKDLSLEQALIGRWFQLTLGVLESLGPALLFALGGYLVIRGTMELGTLVAAVTLLRRLYSPASQLAGIHVDLVTSYAYFERVFGVLDTIPPIRNAPDAVKLESITGGFRFDHVSFAYATGDGPVLTDVDFEAAPGQCIAVVGPSGAGKSTLASLVVRLYDPTEGAVLVDGHDLRKVKIKSLRRHCAVVTQETFLLHATILDNLRYGRPGASVEEVIAAAQAARIHDFIEALPQKYETIVGERGFRLSGGERQRVAIARAILRDPRILILDEATSSLDSQNEAAIQEALDPLLEGRTSLVIAHRLSTVRRADLILVMDKGRIVERGKHDDLLRTAGLYATLWSTAFGDTPLGPNPAEPPAKTA